ncbi:MAG: response regulator [Clostridia bacterium]
MSKKKIMVVDDNIPNLNIAREALGSEYEVFLITSGTKALDAIPKINPDLILLDVEMPDMTGFEVIEQIKHLGEPYNELPIIFVTARDDLNSEFEGLDLGAVDYIIKPYPFSMLRKRVAVHLRVAMQQQQLLAYSHNLESMVTSQVETIKALQHSVVHALSDIVERRDGSTGGHVIRTSEYLRVLLIRAKELKVYDGELTDADIDEYSQASQLHDIGKVSIPDGILLKKGKLTDAEYEIMKTHTTMGEDALNDSMQQVENTSFMQVAVDFVGSHHEKWDGTGYPRGLKGEEIPICGRLMAIADIYDALISDRPYKVAFTHENAYNIMCEGNGTHFDPVLFDIFKEIHEEFHAISNKYRDEARELIMDSIR